MLQLEATISRLTGVLISDSSSTAVPKRVRAHVLLDLVHALPQPHGCRQVEDGIDPVKRLPHHVGAPDIPDDDQVRSPIDVFGAFPPGAVHPGREVVENPDMASMLQQLVCEVANRQLLLRR